MTNEKTHTKKDLINLKPKHDSFVGIDSDGCVFDTMEIKQKKCFHTRIVSHWQLEPAEKIVRETAEFVNLYSRTRGTNRFIALVKMFDLLYDRPEIAECGVTLPELREARQYVDSGIPLGNPSLKKSAEETGSEELASLLKWSTDVNADIEEHVKNIPPYKWVRESFDKIRKHSDAICVSQTPLEALVREWEEHDLVPYVAVIAGQELGTKTEHIAMATKDRYSPEKILMIGDALGDLKAAKDNQALFFPINPAHEAESWERFYKEAYDRFVAGDYAGDYETRLIADFEALLPETPPWKS